jgi:hypothetical protein
MSTIKQVLPLLSLLLFVKTAAAYSYHIIRTGSAALAMSSNSNTMLEETIPTVIDANCSLDPLLYEDNNDDVLNQQQLNGLESSMIGFEAITKSDRAWLKKYNLLVNYYTKHHHTMVPVADTSLGRWVQRQRSYHKQGILSESRVKALNEVKFVFDARNHNKKESPAKKWKKKSWEERYAELKIYFDTHGDSNVPLKSGSLGGWVQYQRQCYDKGKLSTYQIDKMNEIDFIFNVKNYQWDQRFLELKAFIKEHGHSCIPSTSLDDAFINASISTTTSRDSSPHPPRKIPVHPYIQSSKDFVWVDPLTSLEYPTGLCSYLGQNKKEAGRHTLMGVGQYYRTAFNIKVYGAALYMSKRDVLAAKKFGEYATLTAEELRNRDDF